MQNFSLGVLQSTIVVGTDGNRTVVVGVVVVDDPDGLGVAPLEVVAVVPELVVLVLVVLPVVDVLVVGVAKSEVSLLSQNAD